MVKQKTAYEMRIGDWSSDVCSADLLSESEIFRMADEAGLDVAKLKTDMQTPKVEAVLRDNLALADRLGIQGTPAFVIGPELAPGAVSLDSLRHMVQAAPR